MKKSYDFHWKHKIKKSCSYEEFISDRDVIESCTSWLYYSEQKKKYDYENE